MKPYLVLFLATLVSKVSYGACFSVTGVTGTACGAATQYEVSVQAMELCTGSSSGSCTGAATVASTAASFDIASATAGAAVGSYADLNTVTAGDYTHLRTTLSPTIVFSASATSGCSAVSTDTSVTLTANVTGAAGGSVVAGDLSAEDLYWSDGSSTSLYHVVALSDTLAISPTKPLPQIAVDFSTANAHLCVNTSGSTYLSYPGPPVMTVTVTNFD